jgi:hypothetical protein
LTCISGRYPYSPRILLTINLICPHTFSRIVLTQSILDRWLNITRQHHYMSSQTSYPSTNGGKIHCLGIA